MNYKNYFKGKKITVMGLAAEGRGLQDAIFCLEAGAEVVVTDTKKAEELSVALEQLKKFERVTYTLGEHKIEDFTNADMVIRAASAPLSSPYLKAAQEAGVTIHTDESLFFELLNQEEIKVNNIGVTGTRGKSTVTQMIYEVARAANLPVHLGGNLRGVAMLPLLDKIQSGDYLVLELDSWKLQGLGMHQWRPNIAVFTTFMNDHLNYYQGDMDLYLKDKAQIFLYQNSNDHLILGAQAKPVIYEKYDGQIKSQIKIAPADLPLGWDLKVAGEHNRYNAALALEVARLLSISDEISKLALENFTNLPGRLEFLGEKDGVQYWNDNNATSPEAVVAAVKSFPQYQGKIILLGGGADKELDFTYYLKIVPAYVKEFILFAGAATEKIKAGLPEGSKISVVNSMAEAGELVAKAVTSGDLVVLSPGAASFGVFKNEYDRNDQFVELVKKIK